MTTYRTFKRSANNFQEFGKARKITVHTGLSFEQSKSDCQDYNKNRTPKQIAKGTMMEFEHE